ncbi:universal stress protein [Achromobacter spanius]|uniref:universal stress protein n=1 Tax=Achromobacter spanius TaxID=217203 RepID=UPI003209F4F2
MKNVLIPIDGSANALRAVNYVIDQVRESGPCSIHLLNVQLPIVSGTVHAFISKEMIQDYYEDEAKAALAQARIALDKAGLTYQTALRVGPVAATLTAYAAEQKFDHIVMGSRGLGAAGSLLLGSVVLKVLQTVHIPVVVIN